MKLALISATALLSAMAPIAAHAATAPAATATQAICVPVIVDTPEGPVEGVLCFPQGGRV